MKEKINEIKINIESEAPIAHMMVEQCNVFANSTINIIDKRDKLDLIMPWRVQREADSEIISEYLEEGNFDTNNKSFRNLLKDYMMKSKYSYENIGHEGMYRRIRKNI